MFRSLLRALVAPLLLVALPAAALAAPSVRPVDLDVGDSVLVDVNGDVASVVNPNPKLVSVDVQGERKLLLFGLAEGETQIRLLADDGREIDRLMVRLRVDPAPLQALLQETLGEPGIRVRYVGSSVVLSGEVANVGQLTAAADLAQRASGQGGGVVNLLKSRGADQIKVSVKVLEVKRSTLKSLSTRWAVSTAGTQGGGQIGNVFSSGVLTRPADPFSLVASSTVRVGEATIDAFVDFLRTEGQARLLAQPTIVAANGKPAKFLAGGEFPVPVPNDDGGVRTPGGVAVNSFSGIYYKQFGVSLAFTATVLPDGRIDLSVAPEVSSIDASRSIEYGGNRVPALATRRAETSLRLASGETVVFAGLSSLERETSRNRMPLDVLRPFDFLAGPSSRNGADTELLIIVTPTIGGVLETPEALK